MRRAVVCVFAWAAELAAAAAPQHAYTGTGGTGLTYAETLEGGPVQRPLARRTPFRNQDKYSFVHIPKCAGASFIAAALELFGENRHTKPMFRPIQQNGYEVSLAEDQRERPRHRRLTLLRSPRSHVCSQYTECALDPYFQHRTNYTDFPFDPSNITRGFELWIGTFSKPLIKPQPKPPGPHDFGKMSKQERHARVQWDTYRYNVVKSREYFLKNYGCYHPGNMQARAMTIKQSHVHGQTSVVPPSIDKALAAMRNLDYVGLADFFPQSICLFFLSLPLAFKAGVQKLHGTTCDCETRLARKHKVVHITHHAVSIC